MSRPPNLRNAEACGSCDEWCPGYEGTGYCEKYDEYTSSDEICDDFAPED